MPLACQPLMLKYECNRAWYLMNRLENLNLCYLATRENILALFSKTSMRPELIQATERLRRNTREAVEEAIGLLQNTVYSFSMKVCGHPEDAEDTMQEVLYRSMGHLAKIQEPRALAVWLYTVTRNRCWRMRRKPAHPPAQTLSQDQLMPDEAELGRLLEDAASGPEA